VRVWEIPSLTGLDLQPGNIVFAVSAADIDDALSQTGPTVCDVKWRNGVKRDQSAPRHLYVPEPIIDRSLINGQPGHKVMVAITDLGGGAWNPRRLSRKDWLIILKAVWRDKASSRLPRVPRALRAPELISGRSNVSDVKTEIWNLACLVCVYSYPPKLSNMLTSFRYSSSSVGNHSSA
jgi:hypothetical protein